MIAGNIFTELKRLVGIEEKLKPKFLKGDTISDPITRRRGFVTGVDRFLSYYSYQTSFNSIVQQHDYNSNSVRLMLIEKKSKKKEEP